MKNNILLFCLLLFLIFFLNLLTKEFLYIDDLLVNSLSEQLTNEQIHTLLNIKEKWEWLSYAILPVLFLLKVSIIAAVVNTGCFLFSKEIKYKKAFNIVIKAEFVFLLVAIFKIAWFYFFQTNYNLEDLQYFQPLSATNIIGYGSLQPWYIYPLQVLNLFELAYWFILAYLLGKELNVSMDKGFKIVASSYGPALLIWVVAVMFFTLNNS